MNIINAIIRLVDKPILELQSYYIGNNRANNVGDALEEYIKDLFADTFDATKDVRNQKRASVFSYLGSKNNPPDIILNKGDAIEVKKIGKKSSVLALNSSHPKQRLYRDNPMLNKSCKNAEDGNWISKDIIYAVGVVNNENLLKHLCMVYGSDYCASDDVYSNIKTNIKTKVESTPGVIFSRSKELAHINNVDPLGTTYLRVRGMWGIENPWSVFNYVYQMKEQEQFTLMCIINLDKWNTFTNSNELIELSKEVESLNITTVSIKNPDNPKELRAAKLIEFTI